jgi:hypothetical protein
MECERPRRIPGSRSAAADFDRDGWIVARGVVAGDEIAAMSEVFTSLIPEHDRRPAAGGGVLSEITGASRSIKPLALIAADSRFGALAAGALGAVRVQLLQDSLLYKPAGDGAAVAWHQDYTYVGFLTPPRVVSLRIALLPEREVTGCLRVVRGSHRWGQVGEVRALTSTQVDSIPVASPLGATPSQRHAARADPKTSPPSPPDPPMESPSRPGVILRLFDGDCQLNWRAPNQGRAVPPPTRWPAHGVGLPGLFRTSGRAGVPSARFSRRSLAPSPPSNPSFRFRPERA